MAVAINFDNKQQRVRWETLAKGLPALAAALDRILTPGGPGHPSALFGNAAATREFATIWAKAPDIGRLFLNAMRPRRRNGWQAPASVETSLWNWLRNPGSVPVTDKLRRLATDDGELGLPGVWTSRFLDAKTLVSQWKRMQSGYPDLAALFEPLPG